MSGRKGACMVAPTSKDFQSGNASCHLCSAQVMTSHFPTDVFEAARVLFPFCLNISDPRSKFDFQ